MTRALLLEYYRMTHAKPKSWIPEAYASGYFFVGPQMSTADKVSALHDAYIGATHALSPPEPPRPHAAAASSSVPAPPPSAAATTADAASKGRGSAGQRPAERGPSSSVARAEASVDGQVALLEVRRRD